MTPIEISLALLLSSSCYSRLSIQPCFDVDIIEYDTSYRGFLIALGPGIFLIVLDNLATCIGVESAYHRWQALKSCLFGWKVVAYDAAPYLIKHACVIRNPCLRTHSKSGLL